MSGSAEAAKLDSSPNEEQHNWILDAFGVDPRTYPIFDTDRVRHSEASEPVIGAFALVVPMAGVGGPVVDAPLARGIGEGVVDTVSSMTVGTIKDLYALATDPRARAHALSTLKHGVDDAARFGETVITDPGQAASEIAHAIEGSVEAIEKAYDEAQASGHGDEFVGKLIGTGMVLVAAAPIPGADEAEAETLVREAVTVAQDATEETTVTTGVADETTAGANAADKGEAAETAKAGATPATSAKPPAPDKAKDVVARAREKNGTPKQGYKGGGAWENDGSQGAQTLPKVDDAGHPISYREYDVDPYVKGQNRGAERVVVGSDGKSYYTADHYKSFTEVK